MAFYFNHYFKNELKKEELKKQEKLVKFYNRLKETETELQNHKIKTDE
jgi:hypothetical protein